MSNWYDVRWKPFVLYVVNTNCARQVEFTERNLRKSSHSICTRGIIYDSYFAVAEHLVGQPDVSRNALNFTAVLSSFILFLLWHGIQQTRRVRPSNVYRRFGCRWSSNNLPRELVHPPLIFTGVKKCEIWRHFQSRSTLRHRRLKMQQDISTLKQIRNSAIIALCPYQVWWSSVHASQRTIRKKCPTPSTGRRKCAKWSITLPQIVWFCSNFVQSLNTWRRKYHKSSRSRGQRSR